MIKCDCGPAASKFLQFIFEGFLLLQGRAIACDFHIWVAILVFRLGFPGLTTAKTGRTGFSFGKSASEVWDGLDFRVELSECCVILPILQPQGLEESCLNSAVCTENTAFSG